MPTTEFPVVVDSSLLSHFRLCPKRAYFESFEHWKPKAQSVHLIAGAAFARGLEVARQAFYEQGQTAEEAAVAGLAALTAAYGDFECPPDSSKSLERMLGALAFYFSQYSLGADSAKPHRLPSNKLGIEFSFVEPLDTDHPEGPPLLYCGRFDAIMDFASGIWGCDEKTTSSLGASWSRQWDLRSQFTAYTWGARRHDIPLEGFIVRGVSILKTKYDTQQALTYRPTWLIELWYENLLADLASMKQMWESDRWRMNLDDSCNAYGGCPFKKVCMSPPAEQRVWLHQGFTRRRWDPVTRTETQLELLEA